MDTGRFFQDVGSWSFIRVCTDGFNYLSPEKWKKSHGFAEKFFYLLLRAMHTLSTRSGRQEQNANTYISAFLLYSEIFLYNRFMVFTSVDRSPRND